MQKFELVLKNEKVRQYKIFGLLIVLINFFYFVVSAVATENYEARKIYMIGSAFIAAAFFYFFYIQKTGKNLKAEATTVFLRAEAITIILIVVIYLVMQHWWLSVLISLLGVLYLITLRKLIVRVSLFFIVYPSVPKRIIQWAELNNMILKDGLLTIDFKTNKLIQQLTEKRVDAINEKEFNDFCSRQIQSAISA